MLSAFVLLTLAVPYQPVLEAPLAEAWSMGRGGEFITSPYQDDAGVAASRLRLEFRRDDAGYGSLQETFPFDRYAHPTITFPTENARYCWRAFHLNTLNQSSLPSDELCFRTDWTPPTRPAFVDAGAIVSTGRVALDLQPATDALSGVRSYFLEVAPAALGPYQGFADPEMSLPLVAWLGEGTWFGWVRVTDNAGNDNRQQLAEYTVPITITAVGTVPVPEAPRFANAMVSGYGDVLEWDAGWMAGVGVTHVVASFCFVTDAGCTQWESGFHSIPESDGPGKWVQVSGEGPVVARLAVVQGGVVGAWSPPSATLMVDRTPPPVPGGFSALPPLSRAGPFTLRWLAVQDGLTGLAGVLIEETELITGAVRVFDVPSPALDVAVTPARDGAWRYRVASIDRVNNHSAWGTSADVVLDGTGPVSQPPVAQASAVDGGALVSLTWSLPTDLLSGVASEALEERNADGGTQLVAVTGLGASRLVGPGRWRWALRGTDVAGNVGAFSAPSNEIVVTAGGVAIGPSIDTTTASARCGEAASVQLEGAGDPPLRWELVSGPAGLTVSAAGLLGWTPPPGTAGTEAVQVRLLNDVASASGTIQVTVTCASSSDAGTQPQPFKTLGVGCGCSSLEGALILLALGLLRRR